MRAVVLAGEHPELDMQPVLESRFLARLRARHRWDQQQRPDAGAVDRGASCRGAGGVRAVDHAAQVHRPRADLMVAPADALSEVFGFDVSDMSLGLVPR
jgi:hypothetical protein